jgi:hypothetical protein
MTLTDDPNLTLGEDLAAAKEVMVGSAPVIEESPDTAVSLAYGLRHTDGETYSDAEVRELVGADEERLATVKNQVEFFGTVVALGTTRVGPINLESRPLVERRGILRDLLAGDRDRLFLEISRVTFGNERVVTWACERCGKKQETTLLLSEDFPQDEGPDSSTFTFFTSKGTKIKYRLATSGDQDELMERSLNGATMNTYLLSECVLEVDDEMVLNPESFAQKMSLRDRRALLQEMAEKQPSIQFDLRTGCIGCGEEVPLPVGWDLLFQSWREAALPRVRPHCLGLSRVVDGRSSKHEPAATPVLDSTDKLEERSDTCLT